MALRIQRRRDRGWRAPPDTVMVTRPSIFSNPFPVGVAGAELAVTLFRTWLSGDMTAFPIDERETARDRRDALLRMIPTLAGKNLCCWCKVGDPCHADVLLELANATGEQDATTSR